MYNANDFITFYMREKDIKTKSLLIERLGLGRNSFFIKIRENKFIDMNYIKEDKRKEYVEVLNNFLARQGE